MCGIAGAFAYSDAGAAPDALRLARARDRMTCRGPDGCGSWQGSDGRVALAHRRLSIIDLSDRAAQPMLSADGQLAVVFNGEIYNYRELMADLKRAGREFRTTSDTEVLLHLYELYGSEMLEHLQGMYSLAIWDARREGLFLARDPFGIKPLYYADNAGVFRFASEVKALLAGGDIDTRPDAAGHVGFFLWGHVPEPHTLYRGVRQLPAGHHAWVERAHGVRRVRAHADVAALLGTAADGPVHAAEAEHLVQAALHESVSRHLVADVEVGVFLSAGIDSAAIAAIAAQHGGQLRTVTLAFGEFCGTPDDESPWAGQLARRLGTAHHTITVTSSDFIDAREHLLDRMDQPTIDGVNTYFVARAAAGVGLKVALSGLGGDELFGGYPGFRQIPQLVSLIGRVPAPNQIGRGFRRVSARLLGRFTSPKYAALLEYGGDYGGAYLLRRGMFLPHELMAVLDPDMVRVGWQELQPRLRLNEIVSAISAPKLKITALETIAYMRNQLLRDTDWASMSHSLEVRVPLVDWTLWKSVVPLLAGDPGIGKAALAAAPVPPLPQELVSRRKTGFSVPVAHWLAGGSAGRPERGLRPWARVVYGAAA